jgi:hypothetical protein
MGIKDWLGLGLAGWVTLASPAWASDYFAEGLTPDSTWDEILKSKVKGGVRKPGDPRHPSYVAFPSLSFGGVFGELRSVCAEGDALRLAAPLDTGVRLRGYPHSYPLAVHRAFDSPSAPELILLFEKRFEIVPCVRWRPAEWVPVMPLEVR